MSGLYDRLAENFDELKRRRVEFQVQLDLGKKEAAEPGD